MTLGEHLEELRTVLIRSLVALVLACLACIWPAKYLLDLIARPVVLVLRKYGQPDNLLATGPAETIFIYIKVVLFSGLVVASPYILHQIWSFVAAGLYEHERNFVRRLIPLSVALFLAGAAFMYTLVLMISLNFLVGFGSWIPLPQAQPTAIEKLLIQPREISADTQPAGGSGAGGVATVPLVQVDPSAPGADRVWFNVSENRLKLRVGDETYSVQLQRDAARGLVTTHFRIGEYLTFVILMMVAFGVAFQTPLIVVFLVRSGLLSLATIRRSRKIIWLVIVFLAGILAPPDMVSHLLLSIPMILLFELGLLLARERRDAGATPAAGS